MMKAGIVLDAWKLPIFTRRLNQAGYGYEQHPGFTKDTITLTVMFTNHAGLLAIVKAANDEAAQLKADKTMEN